MNISSRSDTPRYTSSSGYSSARKDHSLRTTMRNQGNNYGSRVWTDHQRETLSKAMLGNSNGSISSQCLQATLGSLNHNYDHTKYRFIHEDGTERYCTQHSLVNEFNVIQANIGKVIRRTRNKANGWRIEYDN